MTSKITFEQLDEQHVNILFNGKKVGHIFSPGGTGEVYPNAVQICGFEEAFDLWGCGIFTEKKRWKSIEVAPERWLYEERKAPKKDICLLFSEYENAGKVGADFGTDCMRCFNSKKNCTCEAGHGMISDMVPPFVVKRAHDPRIKDKIEKVDGYHEEIV